MKRSAVELLPGPCIVVNDRAVFVTPHDGLRLAGDLTKLSMRKLMTQEAVAAMARNRKRARK